MPRKKHSVEVIKPDLQLKEEQDLHEKGWVIQRVGWVIMFAIVLAGALGLFGEGLISKQKSSNEAVSVEFERFFRYEAEMDIRIQSSEHIASVTLPQQYIKNFRTLRFEPEPENTTTINDGVVYNFLPGNNRILTIYLDPKSYGTISGTLKVNGTSNFNLNHFIYP
jgi:hypothetical protein